MTYNDKFLVEQWELAERVKKFKENVRWFFVLFICLLMLLGVTWFAGCAQAATLDQWADNIRITEGFCPIEINYNDQRRVSIWANIMYRQTRGN